MKPITCYPHTAAGFPALLSLNDFGLNNNLEQFLQWFTENRPDIDALVHEVGGVLIRNTGINNDQDFTSFVQVAIKDKALDYVSGNSPRMKLGGGVYTSTEFAADREIPIHNEMSYAADWPGKIYFCSIIPAATGGETPLANSHNIYQDLPEHIRNAFEQKQVAYIRNLHSGNGIGASWMDTFETDSRDQVSAVLRQSGTEFAWKSDGALWMRQVRPAIINHPRWNKKIWFNQVDEFHPSSNGEELYEAMLDLYGGDSSQFPMYAQFGDGTEIPMEYLNTVRTVIRNNTVSFPWQKGDIMYLDNIMLGHGRMPFTGERRTLVAMSK